MPESMQAPDEKGTKNKAREELEGEPADKYICVPPLPLDMDEDVGSRRPTTPEVKLPDAPHRREELLDDSEAVEPRSKAARTGPSSSPSNLHRPYFAGGINQFQRPVNDEQWEDEMESYMEYEDMDVENLLDIEALDGCPPEVSEEELKVIEEAAGQEEIQRLLKMGVLRDPTDEELANGDILTTRSVFDWRKEMEAQVQVCSQRISWLRQFDSKDICSNLFLEWTSLTPFHPCSLGVEGDVCGHQRCLFAGGTEEAGAC